MKKILGLIVIVLILLLSVSLVSCTRGGSSGVQESSEQGDDTPSNNTNTSKYTIIWKDWNNTVLEIDEDVLNGTTPTYDGTTPTRQDDDNYTYTFSGWSPSIGKVKKNQTYIAQYTRTEKVHTFTVVWKNWDGTTLETDENVLYGTTPIYNGNQPTKEEDSQYSYTFNGWSPSVSSVSANTIYTAQFTANRKAITISFNLNNGTTTSDTSSREMISLDSSYFFFDVTKENYNFRGWSYKGTKVFDQNGNLINNVTLENDMVFDAIFIQGVTLTINYTLYEPRTNTRVNTFSTLDGSVGIGSGTRDYSYNTNVDLSMNLTEGYEFIGWYYNGSLLSSKTEYNYMMWDEDITLEGRIKYKYYSLNIYSNNSSKGLVLIGKSGNPNDYDSSKNGTKYYTESITISAYTKTDTRFLGWYDENNDLVSTNAVYTFTMPNRDYTLEAKWNYFTVTYNLNEGTNDTRNQSSYVLEDGNITLYNPTRSGYTFVGWYLDDTLITNIDSQLVKHINLEARWSANTNTPYVVNHYKQNIEDDGYTLFETDNLTGTTDTLTNGEVNAYIGFTSPTINQVNINCDCSTIIDLYYTRNIYTLTLSFDDKCGIVEGMGTYKYDEEIIIGANSYMGYNFVGWYSGEKTLSSNESYLFTMPAANIDYMARWVVRSEMMPFLFVSSETELTITEVVDKSLENIIIPKIVTAIEQNTFQNCVGNISFEESSMINVIDKKVFAGYKGESIVLPNTINSIKSDAFKDCTMIKTINIPNSVSNIAFGAFNGCYRLESMVLPFVGTSKNETTPTSNTLFGAIFGNISYSESIAVNQHYASNTMVQYFIPNSLKNVEIIEGTLLYGAFDGCLMLHKIILDDNVSSIGQYAFRGCCGLVEMELPFVGQNANETTSSRTTLFGAIFGAVDYDGSELISQYYSSSFEQYYVPSSLRNIRINGGKILRGSFDDCSMIENIIFGNNVTLIEKYGLRNCDNLTTINVAEGNPYYYSNGNCIIEKNGKKIICGCKNSIIPENENGLTIGDSAFYYCKGLTNINIPNSVVKIENSAFIGCSGLKNIIIPNSVIHLGAAFKNCSSLKTIIIPNSITEMPKGLLIGCSSLEAIEIPFVGKNSTATNASETTLFGYIFRKEDQKTDETTSQSYSSGIYRYYIIPNSLRSVSVLGGHILYGAFYNCENITNITLGDDVDCISECAFKYCSSLVEINISSSITDIGTYAFSNCSSIDNVRIPNGVINISDYAFENCIGLTNIELPNRVVSIGTNCFYKCSLLESIDIPSNVTMLSDDMFNGCSSLSSVNISSNITKIGKRVFNRCESLENFIIPENCTTIGSYAFQGCSNMSSIIIPLSVTRIDQYVFNECTMTIYCERAVQPSTWNINWNVVCEGDVIWSYGGKCYTLTTIQNNENAGSITKYNKANELVGDVLTITATSNDGYTFTGWYDESSLLTIDASYSFNMPSKNTTYEARWSANTNTPYVVNHYLQNIDDSNYTLFETDNLVGTTDTLTNGVVNTYTGFTSPTITQVNINGDGSTVIYLNYTRNSYILTLNKDNDYGNISGGGTYKYEKEVTITATANTGYSFVGWYNDSTLLTNNAIYTFNMLNENIEYEARYNANTYTITIDNQASGVTIIGVGNYEYGTQVTLTASGIQEGYSLVWIVNDIITNVDDKYEFVMGLDVTITTILKPFKIKKIDNLVYLGMYPQTQIVNETIVEELNNSVGELPNDIDLNGWIQREYPDVFFYKDIIYNNEKYRGVYFYESNCDAVFHAKNNGYNPNYIYWFKWEPIVWDIIEQNGNNALLIAHLIIDIPVYENTVINGGYGYHNLLKQWNENTNCWDELNFTISENEPYNPVLGDYWMDTSTNELKHREMKGLIKMWIVVSYATSEPENPIDGQLWFDSFTIDLNNYKVSHIRLWLNDDFYNSVFSDEQKESILLSIVDNSVASTGYDTNEYACDDSEDKIFLLSYGEVTTYYTDDTFRQSQGTDYAKCQGLLVSGLTGMSEWWLRSPNNIQDNVVRVVGDCGTIEDASIFYYCIGVRPAMWIEL